MSKAEPTLICFDVGERRIGVAKATRPPGIAFPFGTLNNDATIDDEIAVLIELEHPDGLVVGLPRNQAGKTTAQTKWVRAWVKKHLTPLKIPVYWQDESLTSVLAEEQLQKNKKRLRKDEVDAIAASLILQDYVEEVWHATSKR